MKKYNIYCDETCYLQNDGYNIMVIGGVQCSSEYKQQHYANIRAIKSKYNISTYSELKWIKISNTNHQLYADILRYFIESPDLSYRGIIVNNKKSLNLDIYHHTYDEWYYKMYYYLLDFLIQDNNSYHIYIDKKENDGNYKIAKLTEYLRNKNRDFNHDRIPLINEVYSHKCDLVQVSDIISGALSYFHRKMHLLPGCSLSKCDLVDLLSEEFEITKTSPYGDKKFNIMIFPKNGGVS